MKKNDMFIMRLTTYEKEKLKKLTKQNKFEKMSDYVREMLFSKNLIRIDFKELIQRNYEINKIGININQIAKKVNSFNEFYYEDLIKLKEEIEKINMINNEMNKTIYNIMIQTKEEE